MKKNLLITVICLLAAAANGQQRPDSLIAPQTKAFMELEFGMFIHFGINTYTANEWTDGTVPASLYNPTKLNTDAWCAAAKSAGMKYVVFTAKHHEGFCNWPTAYSKYSVSSTPYNKDVIAQLAASCKKYGLKLGLYYSLWDRNFAAYADNYAYTEYMKNQLTELLTSYGDILLIWFDGVWDKFAGFRTTDNAKMLAQWRTEGCYNWQWDQIYAHIKHISPHCLVMNNSGIEFTGLPLLPVDIRSGERATKQSANNAVWEFFGRKMYLPMQIEDISSKQYWFYHSGDTTVKSVDQIRILMNDAKSMGANLLLNVGPMEDGQLRTQDVELLKSIGSH